MYHYLTLSPRWARATLTLMVIAAMTLSPLFVSFANAEEIAVENTTETETVVEEQNESEPEEQKTEENETPPGEDGEDGENGDEDTEETPEEPAIIVTGDAAAGLESETVSNFTDTTVETSSSTQVENEEETGTTTNAAEVTASSTDADTGADIEDEVDENTPGTGGLPGDTTSSTTNDAVIDTTGTSTASTGNNEASGDGSVIVTGDAIAYANVVNLANTNIFNSNGLIAFFSTVFGISSLDLRNVFSSIFNSPTSPLTTPSCGYEVCAGNPYLTVQNNNNATITNDINVTANTGGNTVGDDGLIITGDAYAAANIFNLANTNIVDSNYLLLSFNNFGDYAGDIMLPGGNILTELFGAGGGSFSNVTSQNTNNATATNNVGVGADTGGNESEGGAIVTGDASANGSVTNTLNTNLFGGSDLILVFRIHGDWNGEVFGLPEGLAWAETPNGIMLYSTGDGDAGPGLTGNVSVTNTNNATINNNVSVFALTGDNKIDGDGTIVTGDAYAAANVTNVANTNVLGKNWALLIFDIFGDWNGNLTFGQPNLWIGAKATTESAPAMPGSKVTYTYTIMNRGDSIASDIVLDNAFKPHELTFASDVDELTSESGFNVASWNIGDLRPGETKEVSFEAVLGSTLPRKAAVPVSLEAAVHAHEDDADDSDNNELITVYSGENPGPREPGKISFPANVVVTKTASSDTIAPGSTVDYTITLENHGGPLFRSMLRDVLRHEDGEMVGEQYWELGTILTDETITIEYTMQFGEDMLPGTYINSADAVGLESSESWKHGSSYESEPGTHTLIVEGELPAVLGASTDICPAYLKSFLKTGVRNDESEVLKLQEFLNYHTGASIAENGIFDFETEVAVKRFQRMHADDILTPWGMADASGYVYLTTRKKINEISCNNAREFPLSSSQQAEIQRFRLGVELPPESTTPPLPLFGEGKDNDETDITLLDEEEAIKNEVAAIESKTKSQTTTPDIDTDGHPFLISFLKAFNWLRSIGPAVARAQEW